MNISPESSPCPNKAPFVHGSCGDDQPQIEEILLYSLTANKEYFEDDE